MTTIIADGSNRPSTSGPEPRGWVVEAIIEGNLAWLIKPVPLENYTFTFNLAHAHIFEREGEARDCKASVWCSLDCQGFHAPMTVVWMSDKYRWRVS